MQVYINVNKRHDKSRCKNPIPSPQGCASAVELRSLNGIAGDVRRVCDTAVLCTIIIDCDKCTKD